MGYSLDKTPVPKEYGIAWGPNTVLTIPAGVGTYVINSLGVLSWNPYKLRYAFIDLVVGGIHDTSGATNHLSLMNTQLEYSINGGAWTASGCYVPTMYCPANGWIYGNRFYSKYDISSWLVQGLQIDLRLATDGAVANNLEIWGIYPVLRMYLE